MSRKAGECKVSDRTIILLASIDKWAQAHRTLLHNLFFVVLCLRSVNSLWARPANQFELDVMLEGHISKDDSLYITRRREPFQLISLTQCEYALGAIRALTPTDGPEIEAAFTGLRNYTRDNYLYGNGFKPVVSHGQELVVGTRHTAAALGMFRACDRTPPNWEKTIAWMLTMQKGGGWCDQAGAGPDCNTTAAVITALSQWIALRSREHPRLKSKVQKAIRHGFDWLDRQHGQNYEWGWQYKRQGLALTDTCYVIQRISAVLALNIDGLDESKRIKRYLNKIVEQVRPSGAFGRDEQMAAANTVWALSALTEWSLVNGLDEFGEVVVRGLKFIEEEVILKRQSELMLINWTVLVQVLSRILARLRDQSSTIQMTVRQASTMRRLAELFPRSSVTGAYPHELMKRMPSTLRSQFGSVIVFAATHGDHTNGGAVQKDRIQKLKSNNRRLIRDQPWILGLLETMGTLGVIERQHSETRNRISLILLDSNLEIALKEFIVHRGDLFPRSQFGDAVIQKLFRNRPEVISTVIQKVQIPPDLIERAKHYYEMRNKLIHERATVGIADADVNNYRETVEKILAILFNVRFPR